MSRVAEKFAGLGRSTLVSFSRPFEQGSTMGYVLDIGPEFFLLALVDDLLQYNGFQCLRRKDVRGLQIPAKFEAFVRTALRKRGERMPRKPRVSVSSLRELLSTSGGAFPIITIHRETISPDVCHIGQVVELKDKHIFLLEIGPDAHWDETPTIYAIHQITRIDFGGRYEEALTLVGGVPPT